MGREAPTMKVKALTVRILKQLKNDRRTLALILFAPLLLLSLLYFVLSSSSTDIRIGVINAPRQLVDQLYENNGTVMRMSEGDALFALDSGHLTAVINMESGKLHVFVDGSNASKATAALTMIEKAKMPVTSTRPDLQTDVTYRYGSDDLSLFDTFSATLIGFLTFFFVFLISGIFFLKERTTGTLEKLLSTPIQRGEIVMGYVFGFGIIALMQSLLIAFFVVYVLKVMLAGSLGYVFLITLLTALNALSLGLLLSGAATTEFQMVQFIPIVVVPQVFFSGMFDLSPGWQVIGYFMPLYYSADALTHVMMKGHGFSYIALDVLVLLAGSLMFIFLNTQVLKKYRQI